jgi:hypothetical protein
VRPIRVISGRIKVGDYLANLAERFVDLASFEERTRVYPRAFLFDRTMRLGLSYVQQTGNVMPLYFQWTNGRPYRFQSLTAIGRIRVPWLPTEVPTVSLRSDVKSHFFTASFAGHLLSLPAGDSAFEIGQYFLPAQGATSVDTLYNYLALLGGDYGPWSLALGPTFLATRVRWPVERASAEREVTAQESSLTVRLMHTTANMRLRGLYFRTRQASDTGEGLRKDGPSGILVPPESPQPTMPQVTPYRLTRDSVRAGCDLEIGETLRATADAIVSRGTYEERPAMGTTVLDFTLVVGSLSLTQTFGRYVAVTLYGDLHLDWYDRGLAGSTRDTSFRMGGALEFLF